MRIVEQIRIITFSEFFDLHAQQNGFCIVCGVDRLYTMIQMRAALLSKPLMIVLVLVLIAYIMMGGDDCKFRKLCGI